MLSSPISAVDLHARDGQIFIGLCEGAVNLVEHRRGRGEGTDAPLSVAVNCSETPGPF
jgi:hypothetical protein